MSRLRAYGLGLGLVALVATPLFDRSADDSYPISSYPMFARARGKPWLDFVEGVAADGSVVRLAPALVANDEVMQAAATVRRAVELGPAGLAALCTAVAGRVAAHPETQGVRTVRIVGARFDPLRYFVEGPQPEERVEHFGCAVPRQP